MGKRAKKVQNDKKFCPSCSISQEPYIIWLSCMVHMCKMMISPNVFLSFSKILIFWVVRVVKGKKTVQNGKKFCPSRSISQELFITWLSFMVHMCTMIISPGVFFIFAKFWFFGLLGCKRSKNGPKWQKILSVVLRISGTIHHMIVIYGANV